MGGRNFIQFFREKAGYTQTALADLVGISVKSVSRYESGVREPRTSNLQKLATALNTTEAALLNGPVINELRINIFWTKEDIDMNVLSIEPNEVNFACKPKEIILWGSFPNDLTPEQVADRVKDEFIAACEGGSVRDATRKKLGTGDGR